MGSGFVAVGTKLFDFQPFGCVPPVFFSGIPRYTLRPLGGIGPAFSALESDHDPDALAFCHKGRDASNALRNYKPTSYKLTGPNLNPPINS